MPTTAKKARFYGTLYAYCKSPCPVRDVFIAVKDDTRPDTPIFCPRCQRLLIHVRQVPV